MNLELVEKEEKVYTSIFFQDEDLKGEGNGRGQESK